MVQKTFQPFLSHIRVLSKIKDIQKDKTRIWSKKRFSAFFESYSAFLSHIRVLSKRISKRIKHGYGPENVFQPFFSHIRVLSKRIKRGYGPKNFSAFFKPHISAFYPKGYPKG